MKFGKGGRSQKLDMKFGWSGPRADPAHAGILRNPEIVGVRFSRKRAWWCLHGHRKHPSSSARPPPPPLDWMPGSRSRRPRKSNQPRTSPVWGEGFSAAGSQSRVELWPLAELGEAVVYTYSARCVAAGAAWQRLDQMRRVGAAWQRQKAPGQRERAWVIARKIICASTAAHETKNTPDKATTSSRQARAPARRGLGRRQRNEIVDASRIPTSPSGNDAQAS